MEKITKINNFTYKSFKNYTGPENNEKFGERKNVIYGPNGTGKTSLCEGLLREYSKIEPNDLSRSGVRHFDKDYVNKNLLIAPGSRTIKGVALTYFGEDAKVQEEIARLENEKKDVSKLEQNVIDSGNTLISLINGKRKQITANPKIKNHLKDAKAEDDFETYKNEFQKDYDDAISLAKGDIETIKNFTDTSELEIRRGKVENYSLNQFSKISPDTIQNISSILNKDYSNFDTISGEVVSWMEQGLKLHQAGDRCKFCNSEFDYNEVYKKVLEYQQMTIQKDSKVVESFKNSLDSISDNLSKLLQMEDGITHNIHDINPDSWVLIKKSLDIIQETSGKLQSKISNFKSNIIVDLNTTNASIDEAYNAINEILKKRESEIKSINSQIDKSSTLIRGRIAYEVLNDLQIQKEFDNHKKALEELNDAINYNRQKDKDISDAKTLNSGKKDFMDEINKTLKSLNVDLELSLLGEDYALKKRSEELFLMVDDISEGEKNLLALLYFYCELFEDKKKEDFKKSIHLVIIDDPISSLDNSNRIFITQLLRNLCQSTKDDDVQVFILTHSWETYADLFNIYRKSGKRMIFWNIVKDNNGSKIFLVGKDKKIDTPYEHALKEINKIADSTNQPQQNVSYNEDVFGLPNLMRCVLEGYLKMKTLDPRPYMDNDKEIAHVLLGDEYGTDEFLSIDKLIGVCNIFSHETTHEDKEIVESARFLRDCIKKQDPLHFASAIGGDL